MSVAAKDTNHNDHPFSDFYSFPVTQRDYENLDTHTGRPVNNEQRPTITQPVEPVNHYDEIKAPDFYQYKLPYASATSLV